MPSGPNPLKSLIVVITLTAIMRHYTFAQEAGSNQVTSGPQYVTVLVSCDKPCILEIDGKSHYRIQSSEAIKVRAVRGEHVVSAVSADGNDLWEGRSKLGSNDQEISIQLGAPLGQ